VTNQRRFEEATDVVRTVIVIEFLQKNAVPIPAPDAYQIPLLIEMIGSKPTLDSLDCPRIELERRKIRRRKTLLPRDQIIACFRLRPRLPLAMQSLDANDRVMLYLHGGGYFSGSPDGYHGMAGRYTKLLQTKVYMPDYRLAPEHPFPTPINDVRGDYRSVQH
jgi:acetyl esterase/lipase